MISKISLLLILAFTIQSCSQAGHPEDMRLAELQLENINPEPEDFPFGASFSISEVAAPGAYNQLRQNLRKNDAISIIAEVDHQKNARSVGEELDYTSIIFFGNPQLGTPLMQKNQLAGLDLPQKVLFYTDDSKTDIALYNSVEYLRSRHGLEGVSTLSKISGALENLIAGATKSEVMSVDSQTVEEGAGIITKESEQSFEDTYEALYTALESNPNISIMAELDHAANAATVEMDLNPTRIIIFGNPNLGTPLMQEEQSIGLDLPQKMLVWENDSGEVFISYNDPYFLADRHGIENSGDILEKIDGALEILSNTAISN